MGIQKKFFLIAIVAGFIVAAISFVGYYIAYKNLAESVEKEIQTLIEMEGRTLESWLQGKVATVNSAANIMGETDSRDNKLLGTAKHDSEVLTMAVGKESDGFIMTFADGDISTLLDPRTRSWYKDAKSTGKMIFTEVYKDAVTGNQVVSIAVPFKNSAGNFAGVCCEDVALDVLGELAKKINWQGEGFGYIVQSDGKILATSNANETSETALQSEILGKNFQKMLQDGKGYFVNDSQVFGYTTIESTGWIMIVSAPEEIVFAKIDSLRGNFLLMTLFGIAVIIVMMIFCVRFSSRLVKNIFAISDHAAEISKGNLKLQDIEINSEDEMDKLGKSFNKMRKNISQLIAQTTSTARNVATSAEELTTGAQQMANSSTEVAQSVDEVVQGMIEQEKSVRDARLKSDEVFSKMNQLTEQMTQVLNKTGETQENAKSGGELMNNAIAKMNAIEERVNVAAQVVDKLGESSQQIGQIVDAISRIADQTNLLALNAAIEAARAGEHGRGFAVVAEEVRKLAAESQVSAEQIKNLIETIRTDTEQAVTAMATGTGEVKEGTEFIHSVGAQFENILDMVTESKAEIDGMAKKISDMSGDTKTIDDAIKIIDEITRKTSNNTKSISTATEQQSASSEEIAAASQTLSQIADELQRAVNKFKI